MYNTAAVTQAWPILYLAEFTQNNQGFVAWQLNWKFSVSAVQCVFRVTSFHLFQHVSEHLCTFHGNPNHIKRWWWIKQDKRFLLGLLPAGQFRCLGAWKMACAFTFICVTVICFPFQLCFAFILFYNRNSGIIWNLIVRRWVLHLWTSGNSPLAS